jgi:hypothetical protein
MKPSDFSDASYKAARVSFFLRSDSPIWARRAPSETWRPWRSASSSAYLLANSAFKRFTLETRFFSTSPEPKKLKWFRE